MHRKLGITINHFHIDVFWLEPILNNYPGHILAERFARKDVEVAVPCFIAQVQYYITSLYQLHSGVAGLVAFAEVLD